MAGGPPDPAKDLGAFRTQVARLRERGLRDLRERGPWIDRTLAEQLAARGGDARHGVNLVGRPPDEVRRAISTLAASLRELEPSQYYYPPEDLHLTLVEIRHSRGEEEADAVARRVQPLMSALLDGLHVFGLVHPSVLYDRGGCALSLLPADGGLEEVRRRIVERLRDLGVDTEERYERSVAHVTFARYLRPLEVPEGRWLERLSALEPERDLRWTVGAVWLTWGPNWYGMRSRIREAGPYPLATPRAAPGPE